MPQSIPARIVLWQLVTAAAGALVFGLLMEPHDAAAAFIGGAIGAALSFYAATKALVWTRGRREEQPQVVVRRFFRAEAMKFLLAAGLFTLAAVVFAEAWLPLLITFVASQMVYGFALLWKANDGY